MGIPAYFYWLTKKHGNAIIRSCDLKKIRNLYFDFNGILHTACRLIDQSAFSTEKERENLMFESIIKYTDYIIKEVAPTNLVFIAIDGVAPMAKIKQQRLRRFKSLQEKSLSEIDYNMISPSTSFMKNLSVKLHEYYGTISGGNLKYIISDDSNSSEGEHKIIKYVKEFETEEIAFEGSVIYGMDADLIMLALSLFRKDIWIVREDSFVFGKTVIGNPYTPKLIYMDIYSLRLKIIQEMSVKRSHQEEEYDNLEDNQKRYIIDYIFMSFFIGNDFIPSFEAIKIRTGGVDELINIYTSLNDFLIKKDLKINYSVLKNFLSILEIKELSLLSYHKYIREKQQGGQDVVDYKSIGDPVNVKVSGWKQRYYTFFFGNKVSKRQIYNNYIYALNWNLEYYFNGCKDYTWYFPYMNTLLISDFYEILSYDLESPSASPLNEIVFPNDSPISPEQQLLMILPEESLKTFLHDSPNLKKLLNHPKFNYYFPKEFKLAQYGKNYLYECYPIIPIISIDVLNELLN